MARLPSPTCPGRHAGNTPQYQMLLPVEMNSGRLICLKHHFASVYHDYLTPLPCCLAVLVLGLISPLRCPVNVASPGGRRCQDMAKTLSALVCYISDTCTEDFSAHHTP